MLTGNAVSSMTLVISPLGDRVSLQDADEWVKTYCGIRVRYSYQLLTTGFSASAEIIEPVEASIVYTHIHTDLPAPVSHAQIEEEFIGELSNTQHWRADSAERSHKKLGRFRSAS